MVLLFIILVSEIHKVGQIEQSVPYFFKTTFGARFIQRFSTNLRPQIIESCSYRQYLQWCVVFYKPC